MRRKPLAVTVLLVSILAAIAIWTAEQPPHSSRPPGSAPPNAPDANAVEAGLEHSTPDEESARSEALPTSDPVAGVGAAPGVLVFLDSAERRPVSGEHWELACSGAEGPLAPISLTPDVDGRVTVPPGEWQPTCKSGAYRSIQARVLVEADRESVLFVQRLGRLEFQVVDPLGEPIAGADCVWVPLSADPGTPDGREAVARPGVARASTGRDGVARLEGVPIGGTATLTAVGFAREIRRLLTPLEDPLRVELRPASGSPHRLQVVSCVDGGPVEHARVLDSNDLLLATSGPGASELSLPSWVGADEQLAVSAPSIVTGVFRLRDLGDERLVVQPACEATILVHGMADSATLSVTRSGLDHGLHGAFPILPIAAEVSRATPWHARLPQGLALQFLAIGARGELAEREEQLVGSTATIDLVPGEGTRTITITAQDLEGRALRDAFAEASLPNGRMLRLRADSSGRLRMPAEASRKWIAVGAPGHVTASLRYDSRVAVPPPGAETLTVALEPGLDVPFELVGPDGEPLAGLLAHVFRDRPADTPPRARIVDGLAGTLWSLEEGPAPSGITDGRGRLTARGLRAGVVQLHAQLAWELRAGSTYSLEVPGLELHDGSPQVVILDPPRRLALEVRSAGARQPVDGFELRGADDAFAQHVRGAFWQGWIPASCAQLEVLVTELGAAAVELAGRDPDAILEVEVGAERLCALELAGLPPSESPARVELLVSRRTSAGIETVTQTFSRLEGGNGRFAVPLGEHLEVGVLDFELGGRTFECEPVRQPCSPGGSARFEAIERP